MAGSVSTSRVSELSAGLDDSDDASSASASEISSITNTAESLARSLPTNATPPLSINNPQIDNPFENIPASPPIGEQLALVANGKNARTGPFSTSGKSALKQHINAAISAQVKAQKGEAGPLQKATSINFDNRSSVKDKVVELAGQFETAKNPNILSEIFSAKGANGQEGGLLNDLLMAHLVNIGFTTDGNLAAKNLNKLREEYEKSKRNGHITAKIFNNMSACQPELNYINAAHTAVRSELKNSLIRGQLQAAIDNAKEAITSANGPIEKSDALKRLCHLGKLLVLSLTREDLVNGPAVLDATRGILNFKEGTTNSKTGVMGFNDVLSNDAAQKLGNDIDTLANETSRRAGTSAPNTTPVPTQAPSVAPPPDPVAALVAPAGAPSNDGIELNANPQSQTLTSAELESLREMKKNVLEFAFDQIREPLKLLSSRVASWQSDLFNRLEEIIRVERRKEPKSKYAAILKDVQNLLIDGEYSKHANLLHVQDSGTLIVERLRRVLGPVTLIDSDEVIVEANTIFTNFKEDVEDPLRELNAIYQKLEKGEITDENLSSITKLGAKLKNDSKGMIYYGTE